MAGIRNRETGKVERETEITERSGNIAKEYLGITSIEKLYWSDLIKSK